MGVSYREIVADDILVIGQVPIQVYEPRRKTTSEYHFGFLGDTLVEEWPEGPLVHLAREEIQPCLQLGALDRAVGWRQSLGRYLIGNVLHNGRPFREQGAVTEYQGRYVAQRIHLPVVAAAFDDFRVLVDLDGRERQAGFQKHNVR